MTREQAAQRCSRIERLQGGTVVFTNGVFDILHRGHLDYLRQARALGTLLIVGSEQRRFGAPNQGTEAAAGVAKRTARWRCASLRFVDHVVLFDEDTPEKLIEALTPHILVKGGDYQPGRCCRREHVEKQRRQGGDTSVSRRLLHQLP